MCGFVLEWAGPGSKWAWYITQRGRGNLLVRGGRGEGHDGEADVLRVAGHVLLALGGGRLKGKQDPNIS